MKVFEYKIEAIGSTHNGAEDQNLSKMNKMGKEGWELVSVITQSGNIVAYFKRPTNADLASDGD